MSKAILVLDEMPSGCDECKLHIGIEDFAGKDAGCYCLATGLTEHSGTKRGARCPLRNLPIHIQSAVVEPADYTSGYRDGFVYGYNTAVAQIDATLECKNEMGGDEDAD